MIRKYNFEIESPNITIPVPVQPLPDEIYMLKAYLNSCLNEIKKV